MAGIQNIKNSIDLFGVTALLVQGERAKDGLQWSDVPKFFNSDRFRDSLTFASYGFDEIPSEIIDLTLDESLELTKYTLDMVEGLVSKGGDVDQLKNIVTLSSVFVREVVKEQLNDGLQVTDAFKLLLNDEFLKLISEVASGFGESLVEISNIRSGDILDLTSYVMSEIKKIVEVYSIESAAA